MHTLRVARGSVTLLVLGLLLGLSYSFVNPFLSLFGTQEVGMSPIGFGVFMTVSSLSQIVLSTWLSSWSDTIWSRRQVLLLGSISGALGYVGYALTRNVWLLSACSVVLHGLAAVTFGQLFALTRDTLERGGVAERELPLYVNLVRSCFALAWTMGPALGAALVARSFSTSFYVTAGIFALFAVLVAWRVPDLPPSERSRNAASQLPLRVAFRSRTLLAHFLALSLFLACSTMGMMNLPLLILNELHAGMAQVGVAYSVAPFFELPFMLYLGALATRVRHERLVSAAMLLGVFYYAGLSTVQAPLHVYGLQVASAAIVAVTSGVAISYFQPFLPDQVGTATNLYSSAARVGSTLGYLAFGAIAESLGHRAVFLVSAAVSLVCAAVVRTFRLQRL